MLERHPDSNGTKQKFNELIDALETVLELKASDEVIQQSINHNVESVINFQQKRAESDKVFNAISTKTINKRTRLKNAVAVLGLMFGGLGILNTVVSSDLVGLNSTLSSLFLLTTVPFGAAYLIASFWTSTQLSHEQLYAVDDPIQIAVDGNAPWNEGFETDEHLDYPHFDSQAAVQEDERRLGDSTIPEFSIGSTKNHSYERTTNRCSAT